MLAHLSSTTLSCWRCKTLAPPFVWLDGGNEEQTDKWLERDKWLAQGHPLGQPEGNPDFPTFSPVPFLLYYAVFKRHSIKNMWSICIY